jgi:hypothetical protein
MHHQVATQVNARILVYYRDLRIERIEASAMYVVCRRIRDPSESYGYMNFVLGSIANPTIE